MNLECNFDLEGGRKALVRCESCHRENYAMNVLSGICTWCGFDINHKKKEEEDVAR